MSEKLHVSDHPLVADTLTRMRRRETDTQEFRRLVREVTLLMGYEATRDFAVSSTQITTPICSTTQTQLANNSVILVSILRAGLGMVDGMLELLPFARIGHIGLYRDEQTHEPVEYYCKLPEGAKDSIVIVLDPMLATGGSASDAIDMLKERGCRNVRMVNLVAAPDGVAEMQRRHPDVDVYVAALDECLNEDAFIVPGLGDAGDRIFGTE